MSNSASIPITTAPAGAPGASIAAVARDTGIGKDTLRVWERRYGFPQPERDDHGERLYPARQVARLRLIRRLLDQGHRPGRVVALTEEELLALQSPKTEQPPASTGDAAIGDYLALVLRHDGDALLQLLSRDLLDRGLTRFVTEVVAPLTTEVGAAWSRGELRVFEEHLYSEVMRRTLRAACATVPANAATPMRPRVVLSTFPQEPHELGLLMAEAMFTLAGCRCQSLGVQMPLPDIAAAASAHRSDIVALSFSAALNPKRVADDLTELRLAISRDVQIWVGGTNAALRRRTVPEGVLIADLGSIAPAVAAWRERAA